MKLQKIMNGNLIKIFIFSRNQFFNCIWIIGSMLTPICKFRRTILVPQIGKYSIRNQPRLILIEKSFISRCLKKFFSSLGVKLTKIFPFYTHHILVINSRLIVQYLFLPIKISFKTPVCYFPHGFKSQIQRMQCINRNRVIRIGISIGMS